MTAEISAPSRSRANRIPRKWRLFIAITASAAVAIAAFAFLRSYALGSTTAQYSSYSKSADGYDTWYRLLASYNVDVAPVRGNLTAAKLDPARTLVIAGDTRDLSRWEIRNVVAFVRDGGRLVVIGDPGELGSAITGGWFDRSPFGPTDYRPLTQDPTTDGVTTVTGGDGEFSKVDATPLYGSRSSVVTVAASLGKGTAIFVADPMPMTNAAIDRDDNALYALRLTTLNRPVDFAEGIHGFRDNEFYADVPIGWRLAALGLILAGVVFMISRARRLGPAEREFRTLPPPRRLYIDAFARALRKAKQPSRSVTTVQRNVRRIIGERSGISPDASDEAFIAGGIRLGIPEDEITAAIRPVTSERTFVLATRAFTRLNQEGGPRERTP